MTPFWWSWPSWIVESIAGAGLQLALHFAMPGSTLAHLAAGLALSAYYEFLLDSNRFASSHRPWLDMAERVPAQLLTELLLGLL